MKKRFNNWKPPVIKHGKLTKWNWVVYHPNKLKLGKFTDIGAFSFLNAKHGIIIKNNVQIGSGVKIYSVDTISNKSGKVVLEKNCKIGANSVILPNTQIGENSVIGACSFVPYGKIIPPNQIWAGTPAIKIGIIKNGKRKYCFFRVT